MVKPNAIVNLPASVFDVVVQMRASDVQEGLCDRTLVGKIAAKVVGVDG